ncbi:MAG TPA: phosphopantetheine-binding protein [Bacteroidales bacterium]|nr:phosphopantetheine-binding protein [Bacteroidales bacterium]
MDIQEFIEKIEGEFEDLEKGVLKPESNFRDVFDWNSVNALIFIALVSTEYDVTVTAEDLRVSKTIGDIYNIIKSRCSK